MTKGMGAPGFFISLMRLSPQMWSRLTAVARTLPYDVAVMGDTTEGKPLSPADWESAQVDTLVLSGAKSPDRAGNAGRALAEVLPNARHEALIGQSYNIKMKPLAPVLKEFFSAPASRGPIAVNWATAVERAKPPRSSRRLSRPMGSACGLETDKWERMVATLRAANRERSTDPETDPGETPPKTV